jgi:hypothetical protein
MRSALLGSSTQELPVPVASLPGKSLIMLIILMAIAVILSLVAELFYGYLADPSQIGWVRSEVSEHAAIMRQLGRMRIERPEF